MYFTGISEEAYFPLCLSLELKKLAALSGVWGTAEGPVCVVYWAYLFQQQR